MVAKPKKKLVNKISQNERDAIASPTSRPGLSKDGRSECSELSETSGDVLPRPQGGRLLTKASWIGTTSLSVHIVPYLITIGYKPAAAALAMGITFGFAAGGNVFFGWLGDKVRSRFALSASLFGIALAVLALLGASHITALAAFIVIYGVAHQGPVFGVPLTIAESLGLKRFGSIYGLVGFVSTIAGTLGPLAGGRLFDATGSYIAPFTLFLVSLTTAAILPFGCVPLARAMADGPPLAVASR